MNGCSTGIVHIYIDQHSVTKQFIIITNDKSTHKLTTPNSNCANSQALRMSPSLPMLIVTQKIINKNKSNK